MAETDQLDLAGKKLPDVNRERRRKEDDLFTTKHLVCVVGVEAYAKLITKLDKQVEKRKISPSDKSRRIKAWIQSKARMKSSKDGLTEGLWDKETKQLCDEIMGE